MANLAELATQAACAICAARPLCQPRSAKGVASLAEGRMTVAAGRSLYRAGEPRDTIYALRSGFAQVVVDHGNDSTHIVRFLLPGDAAGLDTFAGGEHAAEVQCIEDCEVCVIPAARLEVGGPHGKDVAALLCAMLARELASTEEHAAVLAHHDARQRVAGFLLDLSRRWSGRGLSPTQFRLPMGRRAIGQHLALTTETVSRVLSEFQSRGWVELPWREVRILDLEALRALLLPKAATPS